MTSTPDAEPAPGAGPRPVDAPPPRPLLAPADGVPPVVVDPAALADIVAQLAAGTGPVAVDAERASGYRYGQRAYLVQFRRAGTGTVLIDPVGCPDLSAVGAAIADAEWVLHAASQDLPCLAGVGLRPVRLFDTELAGRLAGYERVGLGALVENLLGYVLEKGHSAADWSHRPLPDSWLRYAALDVEVLVELRDRLAAELAAQGKLEWALEEFAALAAAGPPAPRPEPWRRTSGIHRVRTRRSLAVLRAAWEVRDEIARARDLAPGRVLRDSALVTIAQAAPTDVAALAALPEVKGVLAARYLDRMQAAVSEALLLPETALPRPAPAADGPPPSSRWADRNAEAGARLTRVRLAVSGLADEWRLPTENLLSPDIVRRVSWDPPVAEPDAVAAALTAAGARRWQVQLTAGPIAAALGAPDRSTG